MRRALSSGSGFLGFLDLGFGLLRFLELPELRLHGSGLRQQRIMLGGGLLSLKRVFGGGFNGDEWRNEDFKDSISIHGVFYRRKFQQGRRILMCR